MNEKLWVNLVVGELTFILWIISNEVLYLILGLINILYFIIGNFIIEICLKRKQGEEDERNNTT